MGNRTQRVVLALVGAFVALGPVASMARANPEEAPTGGSGACTDDTGITVIVDASAFGDGVQVRCARQPVNTGFEALTRAGFTITGTTQFPGLLCRIDGNPSVSDEPCHGAPPADAYWAYWHAPRGGSWTYSTSGGGSRKPPLGSVEGWAFGDDAEPGVDPPDPPPTTTTRPSTATTQPSADGTDGGPDSGTPTTGADTTSSTIAGGSGSSTTTSRDVIGGGSPDDGGEDEVAGAPRPGDGGDSGGGSPVGAVVGLGAAAALATAGIRVARRRASEEELA